MGFRDFESEIVSSFKVSGYVGVSPTGYWIRGHLMEVGEDYTKNMYEKYVSFIDMARLEGVRLKRPGYRSFVNYIIVLRKLNLIRISSVAPPVKKFAKPRRYYALNPEKINSPEWNRPVQTLYPITDPRWRRIRKLPTGKKALKRPRRPRGRPRTTTKIF